MAIPRALDKKKPPCGKIDRSAGKSGKMLFRRQKENNMGIMSVPID
jgi:hypothetical protein